MPPPDSADSASPDRFRAIVEAQSELISLSRPDGQIVYANPAFARQFGLEPGQILGRNLFEFVMPDDVDDVRRKRQEVLSMGQPRTSEHRMVDGSGRAAWIVWTSSVQREAGEALLCSVGRDMTRRKALEDELVENDAFVRNITDNLPQRIACVDRDLRFGDEFVILLCGVATITPCETWRTRWSRRSSRRSTSAAATFRSAATWAWPSASSRRPAGTS